MTNIYSGMVAAGQTITTAPVTLTTPYRGVMVSQTLQFPNGYSERTLKLNYAQSLDGTNFGEFQTAGHEIYVSDTGRHTNSFAMEIDAYASALIFEIANQDVTNTANLTLEIQTFQ